MSRTSNWVRVIVIAAAIAVVGTAPVYAQRSGSLKIPTQMGGKVLMEDGTPPAEPVPIEARCGSGRAFTVARTNATGGFVIASQSDTQVADARLGSSPSRGNSDVSSSNSAGGAPTRLSPGCSVEAHLVGYTSTSLVVMSDTVNDLGTIILHRKANVEGSTESVTTLKAPKDAQKAYEKAMKALEKKKSDEARPLLEAATKSYPQYAIAWFELGKIHQEAGDLAKAQQAYEQAMGADPKFIKPYIQVTTIFYKAAKWKELAAVTARTIELNPVEYPSAYVYNASSNLKLGDPKAAEASARQAVKVDVNHTYPLAEFFLGLSLADQGNVKEGADHFRSYLLLQPNSPNAEAIKKQLAAWEQTTAAGAPK
jgi:cytochrome c-type biogenesis protein CcmH/NrfG